MKMKELSRRLVLIVALFSAIPSLAAAEIKSTSGTIGGWTLSATSQTAGSGATTVGLDSGGTNPAFYAGSATPSSAPFRVTNTGAVNASNLTVTGGSITGTTATFASVVTLDSNGIAITPSTSGFVDARAYKFGNGVGLYAVNDNAFVRGTVVGLQATGSRSLSLGSGGLLDENGNIDMNIGGAVRFPGVNTSGATRYLCISAAGLLSAATAC